MSAGPPPPAAVSGSERVLWNFTAPDATVADWVESSDGTAREAGMSTGALKLQVRYRTRHYMSTGALKLQVRHLKVPLQNPVVTAPQAGKTRQRGHHLLELEWQSWSGKRSLCSSWIGVIVGPSALFLGHSCDYSTTAAAPVHGLRPAVIRPPTPADTPLLSARQKTARFQRAVLFSLLNPQPNGAGFVGFYTAGHWDLSQFSAVRLRARAQGQNFRYKVYLKHHGDSAAGGGAYEAYFEVSRSLLVDTVTQVVR